jgi:hypothetical protein
MAGCSLPQLKSVPAPTPDEVATYVKEMRTSAASVQGMTPREYLTASIVYSNQKCKDFFVQLAEFDREAQLAERLLNAATAAGTSLFPIQGNEAKALRGSTIYSAIITGGIAFTTAVREVYAFKPYANELGLKVTESQNVFLAADSTRLSIKIVSDYSNRELADQLRRSVNGTVFTPIPDVNFIIDINAITRDEAMMLARYIAQGYAYQCSVVNINNLIRNSITHATIANVASGLAAESGLGQAAVTAVAAEGPVVFNNKMGSRLPTSSNGSVNRPRPEPPPTPAVQRIGGAQGPVEQALSRQEGEQLQRSLCVKPADGNFGNTGSLTRQAISLMKQSRNHTVSAILTSPEEVDFLFKLGDCPPHLLNIFERIQLSDGAKVAELHQELLKAMRFLQQKPGKSGQRVQVPVQVAVDDFGRQTQITASTRLAIQVVAQSIDPKAKSEQFTFGIRGAIKDYIAAPF